MTKGIQQPPGTRDFYPEQMALRRTIEDAWRRVSLRHGFVEVDGPTFEFLDLYKVKSGDEIVSQLFHFETRENEQGESKEFALRPEFTPTLARMIAARANALPRPIKWFSIPRCYRAERQQKGRLKEFFQWNVDMLGGETPEARRQFDLEVAALCLEGLRELGLGSGDVVLLWNDRRLVEELFKLGGVPAEKFGFAFYLLDRVAKLSPEQRAKLYGENGIDARQRAFFEQLAGGRDPLNADFWRDLEVAAEAYQGYVNAIGSARAEIEKTLELMGHGGCSRYDASIVRGLAYYTGFVWEVADARGENRAVAGGGRYDKLIEMFGGPPLPATGFGMGDVVLAILLQELGKLPASVALAGGRADVFIVNALATSDEAVRLAGALRASRWDAAEKCVAEPGLAVGMSYKATKNIGKLLQDAAASGAKVAVIFAPAEWERGVVKVKNLLTREEGEVPREEVAKRVREMVRG